MPGKKYPSTTGPKGNITGFENTWDCASKTSWVVFVLTHAFSEFISHPTASAKLLECVKNYNITKEPAIDEIVMTIVKLSCVTDIFIVINIDIAGAVVVSCLITASSYSNLIWYDFLNVCCFDFSVNKKRLTTLCVVTDCNFLPCSYIGLISLHRWRNSCSCSTLHDDVLIKTAGQRI